MNEERFVLCKKGDKEYVEDNCCVQLYGFDGLCEMLNEFNNENKELEEKKIELMECNALQYQEIQNWESENKVLRKIIFLYEKGITMLLSKEEQMKLYNYVDLELRRGNDED